MPLPLIKFSSINKVIGFIMDGNRRWAKKNIVNLGAGYAQGADIFFMVISQCIEYNIKTIIFYAMSSNNFKKRSKQELTIIYEIGIKQLNNKKKFFIENKIKIVFIGDISACDETIRKTITEIEAETNEKEPIITVYILMIYDPYKDIFNYHINKKLFYSSAVPDIDLIIRTGGFNRLSGFLPIQSMNANIITLEELWPDLTKEKLYSIFTNYKNTQNYGK